MGNISVHTDDVTYYSDVNMGNVSVHTDDVTYCSDVNMGKVSVTIVIIPQLATQLFNVLITSN